MARTLGATITTEPSPIDSESNAGLPGRWDRFGIENTHYSDASKSDALCDNY